MSINIPNTLAHCDHSSNPINPMQQILTVYESPYRKLRLGELSDGGYVIAELGPFAYDCYISAGVGTEELFSHHFIHRYPPSITSFAFDGTIGSYPEEYRHPSMTFIPKNIANHDDDNHATLSDITDAHRSIFLKMDIEGGEYGWLDHVSRETLDKFSQIVMEIHGINDDSWGCPWWQKIQVLQKLNDTHILVHAHGNNFSGCENGIQDVIELTYIHRRMVGYLPLQKNRIRLPDPNLDFSNDVDGVDIDLNIPPFVHTDL